MVRGRLEKGVEEGSLGIAADVDCFSRFGVVRYQGDEVGGDEG